MREEIYVLKSMEILPADLTNLVAKFLDWMYQGDTKFQRLKYFKQRTHRELFQRLHYIPLETGKFQLYFKKMDRNIFIGLGEPVSAPDFICACTYPRFIIGSK